MSDSDQSDLGSLRAEIDALDDQLHALLARRAAVVARLASSGAKGGAPLRPGREAAVLRRLLARTEAPLLPAVVVRLWREIFAAGTAQQGSFAVAAQAGAPAALAAAHFGLLAPLRAHPSPSRALAAVAAGEAAVAVLALPRDGEPTAAAWWLGLDAPRLSVVARLPFWSVPEPETEALVVAAGAADPTGSDRTLLRLEGAGGQGRAQLAAALLAAGLPPRSLVTQREEGVRATTVGVALRALAEVDGTLTADDARLSALGALRPLPIGCYAVPLRGDPPVSGVA